MRANPELGTGTDARRAGKELQPRATSSLMTCPVLSALGEADQQGFLKRGSLGWLVKKSWGPGVSCFAPDTRAALSSL